GPSLGLRGEATTSADGERFATLLDHRDDAGLAEQPPGLGAGDRGPALVVRTPGGRVIGEDVGVDVDHDLAAGRVAGPTVHTGAGLGQRGEGGDPAGGPALAGETDGGVLGAALGEVGSDHATGGADLLLPSGGLLVPRAFAAGV